MRISIPINIDLTSISTNVLDNTPTYDVSVHEWFYESGLRYKYDGMIYENTGNNIYVPLYDINDTYFENDVVYKDNLVQKAGYTEGVAQPAQYIPAPDVGFDYTAWTTRYAKLFDVNPNFIPNKTDELNGRSACMSSDGLHFYEGSSGAPYNNDPTQGWVAHYSLSVPYDIETKTLLEVRTVTSSSANLAISPDGTKLFMGSNEVKEYSLSPAYSISNFTYIRSISRTYIGDIHFSSDGTRFYLCTSYLAGANDIEVWTTPNPYSLLGASLEQTYNGLEGAFSASRAIYVSNDNNYLYVAGNRYSTFGTSDYHMVLLKYEMAGTHNISTLTLVDKLVLPLFPYDIMMKPDETEFYMVFTNEAKKYYCSSAGVLNGAMHNPSLPNLNWFIPSENIIITWEDTFFGIQIWVYDYNHVPIYYTLTSTSLKPVYYSYLTSSSSVYPCSFISILSNTKTIWLPRTFVWSTDGYYVRTHIDAPQQIVLNENLVFSPVYTVDELPNFTPIEPTNDMKPFDGKNYSSAERSDIMTYTIVANSKFDTIGLGGVIAESIVVKFAETIDELNNGTPTTEISHTINTDRDIDGYLEPSATTLIYYSDALEPMPAGSVVEITLTVSDSSIISLSTIMLGMSADAGFTNLSLQNTYKDFSVFEYDAFGNVDYTDRARVSRYTGTVDMRIENYDMTDRLMTSLGKELVIVNGSDLGSDQADSTSIFAATQKIGRFINFNQKTVVKDDDLDVMATYSFTLEEIV